MKRLLVLPILLSVVFLAGCDPIERTAYNTFVSAKAALVSFRSNHGECAPYNAVTGMSPVTTINACVANNRITAAKDSLIDAAEVYCSSQSFEAGGVCTPPSKDTTAGEQALAKLQSALNNYKQTAADFRGVFGQ